MNRLADIYGVSVESVRVKLHCSGGVVSKRCYYIHDELVLSCIEDMDMCVYSISVISGGDNEN